MPGVLSDECCKIKIAFVKKVPRPKVLSAECCKVQTAFVKRVPRSKVLSELKSVAKSTLLL